MSASPTPGDKSPGKAGTTADPAPDPAAVPTDPGATPADRHPTHGFFELRTPVNLVAAIYGSVLAASVIVGSGSSHGGFKLAILLVGTGVVFWLAHVYAVVVSTEDGWRPKIILRGMRHESPLIAASLLPALAAAIAGLFHDLSPAEGAWIALAVALAEQQVWAFAAARRANASRTDLVRAALLNVTVGAIIVLLKVFVGH